MSNIHPVVRLGVAELEARLGVDRSTIFRWYKGGKFPAPEYINDRRTWRLDVVEAFEQAQLARPPEARRGAANFGGGAKP
jgi:predicted DNA-binding transcriptional regulator AlpA